MKPSGAAIERLCQLTDGVKAIDVGKAMKLVAFGLTVSTAWGNGHAVLWRALCRAIARRGHRVVFFQRDVPYYVMHRDLTKLPGSQLHWSGDHHRLALWGWQRDRRNEYSGTLVNAYLAREGEAWAVRAGRAYVDVGTLRGYREAIQLLSAISRSWDSAVICDMSPAKSTTLALSTGD